MKTTQKLLDAGMESMTPRTHLFFLNQDKDQAPEDLALETIMDRFAAVEAVMVEDQSISFKALGPITDPQATQRLYGATFHATGKRLRLQVSEKSAFKTVPGCDTVTTLDDRGTKYV